MKCIYYSKDNVQQCVVGGLSLTPAQFVQLPYATQQDILQRNAMIGCQGSENPDWEVPLFCQRGATLPMILDYMESLDEQIKRAGYKKQDHLRYLDKLRKLNEKNEPTN